MGERILACSHAEQHVGTHPLYDAPLCAYCHRPLDVVGVETIIQGGGTDETATALECPCGYRFTFNPSPEPQAVAGGTPT